jgi:hypothetical protein
VGRARECYNRRIREVLAAVTAYRYRMQRWRRNLLIYSVITLWTLLPILCVLVASAVASACGCTVDEGAVHPCFVFNIDIGTLLYTLGVMGWLGLVTLPTGAIAFVLYTIFAIVEWLMTLRRQRRPPPMPL